MPGPSLQAPSIVWPGQRYRTTHYSRISSQGESLVLALAQRLCQANNKQKPLASTFYILFWIGLTCVGAAHIDLSHPATNGILIVVVLRWLFHSKEWRKTVLYGGASLCRKVIVMVGSFSCLVLFLFWIILPFISSGEPERTRVEQRDMWRHIGETGGSWGDFLSIFLNLENIPNAVEQRS